MSQQRNQQSLKEQRAQLAGTWRVAADLRPEAAEADLDLDSGRLAAAPRFYHMAPRGHATVPRCGGVARSRNL
jgi:hypothetical protein